MKWLRDLIKVAAIALTSPATIEVASSIYPDQPFYRIMVSAAALILVEGTLLLGWYRLDTDKQATQGQRALYAIIALVAYVVLWIVAIAHGEGVAGIAFRFTLGVMIGYSIFESGILAGVKLDRKVAQDIMRDRGVKKHQRKAEIYVARLGIDYWKEAEVKRLEMGQQQLLSAISAPARPVRVETPIQLAAPRLAAPVKPARVSAGKLDPLSRKLLNAYAENPMLSTRDAGKLIGTSHQTVRNRLAKLETAGVIHRNGHGVEILSA